MTYSLRTKNIAIDLRKKGYSLKEITERLHIAKSTASVWLSDIELSPTAQKQLMKKQILGQYKTVLLKKSLKEEKKKQEIEIAFKLLKNIHLSKDLAKIYCALLWWCEGNKNSSFVRFTSSDETLISNFIFLFRLGFDINENKFRVLVHIHGYHNDDIQKAFWSSITKIPLKQFHNSYKKPNTGKRQRKNYQGCIALTYYDAKIAKELEGIYNAFTLYRGVR